MTAVGCKVCGVMVVVVPTLTNVPGRRFACWCGCENVSPTDQNYRGVGYGDTQEEAVEAWRNWSPNAD